MKYKLNEVDVGLLLAIFSVAFTLLLIVVIVFIKGDLQ